MAEPQAMQGNLEINKKGGLVTLSINPKIYPLDVVLSVAYLFTEKNYVLVDGDPNEELVVEIRSKDPKADAEAVGRAFNNELITYATYAVQSIKNQALREAILNRVLLTNAGPEEPCEVCEADARQTADGWQFDDPEGIAIPWDEKYGKAASKEGSLAQAPPKAKATQEEEPKFDDPEGIAIPWEEKYGKKETG